MVKARSEQVKRKSASVHRKGDNVESRCFFCTKSIRKKSKRLGTTSNRLKIQRYFFLEHRVELATMTVDGSWSA